MLIYNNLYRHVICACYGHVKTKATWLIFWFWILTTVHKLNQLDYIYLFYLRLYHQLTIHYQVKIIRSFLSTIFLIKMIKILRPNCLQIYLCRWQIWLFYFHGTLLFPSTWFRIKSIYLGRGGGIFPWFKAHPFDYFLVAHNKTKVPLFFSKWEIRT